MVYLMKKSDIIIEKGGEEVGEKGKSKEVVSVGGDIKSMLKRKLISIHTTIDNIFKKGST